MSALVKDVLKAELGAIERVQPAPLPPFGWGTDLRCRRDLDERARDVDGRSIEALADALFRRLDCAPGDLPDDASYGLLVEDYLNRDTTRDEIAQMEAAITAQLGRDPRVTEVVATVTVAGGNEESLTIGISVRPADPELVPFDLVLALTDAGLLLEDIRRRG